MLAAIALLITIYSYTLTISGIVIQTKNNSKLSEVNIYAVKKNTGTTTDKDGRFKIDDCDPNDTIVFSSIGYESRKITTTQLLDMKNIELIPYAYELNEIKILSITPKELLKQIIENYSNNYSITPLKINCIYNEYILHQNQIISATLSEGELCNYFTLKSISGKQNKFIPKNIIKYSNHGKYSNRQYVSYYTLFNYSNLYPSLCTLLENIDQVKEYNISESIIGNYKIYKLYLEGKQKTILFIDQQSKAVIGLFRENKYNETPTLLKNDTCGFISKKRISSNTYISFRPYKGKWYLHAIKSSMEIEYSTQNEKIAFEAKSIFQSSSISEDNKLKIPKTAYADLSQPIYNQLKKFKSITINSQPEIPETPSIDFYK